MTLLVASWLGGPLEFKVFEISQKEDWENSME